MFNPETPAETRTPGGCDAPPDQVSAGTTRISLLHRNGLGDGHEIPDRHAGVDIARPDPRLDGFERHLDLERISRIDLIVEIERAKAEGPVLHNAGT